MFHRLEYISMTWHVQETMVQKSRLMRAVTSGLSTGGSLALAFKLLNWAEKADYLSPIVHPLGHWRFDCPSFVLGLLCGIALFLFIEAWVTLRWAVVSWLERPVDRLVSAPRGCRKPLYKLC